MLRRELFSCVMAMRLAGRGPDPERIWKEYLEWYRKQPLSADLRVAYRKRLQSEGLDAAEIEERCRIVERFSHERRGELQPYFFDLTYAAAEPRFNSAPNALLVETVRDLAPGRALDIHMGQGRNAVFLASMGWDVTAFDYSAEGVRAARAAAAKAGVRLTALLSRHEDFTFGREQWDLVVMTYTWVPLRGPYIGRIIDSLKPGGLLVFEHLMDESGSPKAAPWLPRPGELPEIFGRLRVLRYEDARRTADWSWRPERVARLVARKPPAPDLLQPD